MVSGKGYKKTDSESWHSDRYLNKANINVTTDGSKVYIEYMGKSFEMTGTPSGYFLMETGDFALSEAGNKILLE